MRLPTYFISHGGGPWPWLKKEMPMYDQLERSLQEISREIAELPKAVLVISGHWEEPEFTVMANARPPMLYDYGGFPSHTYEIKYDAPGAPEVAGRVQKLIQAATGFKTELDHARGFDHGTFVPLYVMYPEAKVPVLQLSLHSDYDPEAHLKVGRALAPLRDEGVLIVGSGLSYHNMSGFFGKNENAKTASQAFDQWLQKTLIAESPKVRTQNLLHWSQAPGARDSHPSEDHLIPLMVAVGAAENETARAIYHQSDLFSRITASSFRFGADV